MIRSNHVIYCAEIIKMTWFASMQVLFMYKNIKKKKEYWACNSASENEQIRLSEVIIIKRRTKKK